MGCDDVRKKSSGNGPASGKKGRGNGPASGDTWVVRAIRTGCLGSCDPQRATIRLYGSITNFQSSFRNWRKYYTTQKFFKKKIMSLVTILDSGV